MLLLVASFGGGEQVDSTHTHTASLHRLLSPSQISVLQGVESCRTIEEQLASQVLEPQSRGSLHVRDLGQSFLSCSPRIAWFSWFESTGNAHFWGVHGNASETQPVAEACTTLSRKSFGTCWKASERVEVPGYQNWLVSFWFPVQTPKKPQKGVTAKKLICGC